MRVGMQELCGTRPPENLEAMASFRFGTKSYDRSHRSTIHTDYRSQDAEQAISTMSGEWLGSRQIRVNWANQKTGAPGAGGNDGSASSSAQGQTYESVLAASSETNSTVYVGNLAPGVGRRD